MLKKKHVILVVLAFCLVAALFVGVTISQNAALESTTPQKGYLHVPGAAFTPQYTTYDWRNYGYRVSNYEDSGDAIFYAAVQLPHGATVTNLTYYYTDEGWHDILCSLRRFNRTDGANMFETMASVWSDPATSFIHATTINHPTIDNSKYTYYLYVLVGPKPSYYQRNDFYYAVIEYECLVPPITPETRYQDASIWVDQSLLPGTRINLFAQNEIQVTEGDVTHVQHGFVTDEPWSEMSEEEKTIFLSTNEFHLYVNDEEVPLTHMTRHDSVTDYVESLYYRVFPPGYFELNRLHRLRGEWYWLNYTSGEWVTFVREGTLRCWP